jgi:hypothetical protein
MIVALALVTTPPSVTSVVTLAVASAITSTVASAVDSAITLDRPLALASKLVLSLKQNDWASEMNFRYSAMWSRTDSELEGI